MARESMLTSGAELNRMPHVGQSTAFEPELMSIACRGTVTGCSALGSAASQLWGQLRGSKPSTGQPATQDQQGRTTAVRMLRQAAL